jgi:addiction module HigA family antidote
MSAYRDALTKLFLKGAFSKGEVPQPSRRESTLMWPKAAPEPVRAPAPRPAQKRITRAVAPEATPGPEPVSAAPQDSAHPGKQLASKLRAHGKTASDLARDMHVPVNRVTAIINGQRGVTADTALRLGHWFGETPETWLDAQQRYELARARSEFGAEIRRLPRLASSR